MAPDFEASLRRELPVELVEYTPPAGAAGLVLVDEVNGFCTPGAGPLAPQAPDERIAAMIALSDDLARRALAAGWPVLATLDTHEADRPEPPYPPHCIRGSGDEDLVPALAWLADEPNATLMRKDCINAFVGAIEPLVAGGAQGASRNHLCDWIATHRLQAVVVAGICTDVCVMDLVLTLLSARNHGVASTLRDVVVLEPACATYGLPREAVEARGLPATAAHPQAPTHHLGLYFMASRGAVLARSLTGI